MSAVPKKKLCWHCDGNVAMETDNCPYCGVYLLATEDSEGNRWSPDTSHSENKDDSAPSPLYQMQQEENSEPPKESQKTPFISQEIVQKLKIDIGPILMLMSGSIFFLFGVILYLFAQDGVLTLQWNANNWIYFLGLSVPLMYLGYRLLQQVEQAEE